MLVFQHNWEHIKDRCTRVEIKPDLLVDIVAEINLYLPDDWRMTRSRNNFRVQVVGPQTPALVGFSFSGENGEIFHVIDSVFLKHYFDQHDLEAAGGVKGPVDSSFKRQHPEIIHPNLYFFRPCPDDSKTPLFARQYEKIRIGKDGEPVGDQYHRIHPLTKTGLDLEHFRWVRWTINGDVEQIPSPASEYHGKDYWNIPPLKNAQERGSRGSYVEHYRKILSDHKIRVAPPAQAQAAPYDLEYKFLAPRSRHDAVACFALISETIQTTANAGNSDLKCESTHIEALTDTYLDDENLTLHGSRASLRLRERKNFIEVSLKKRFPVSLDSNTEPPYRRIEENAIINSSDAMALRQGRPINAFPYRLVPYVAPTCGRLQEKFTLTNKRKHFILKDPTGLRAELSLDEMYYEFSSGRQGPFFEVEIEGKGASEEKVGKLVSFLQECLGIPPVSESKYERGIALLSIKNGIETT